MSLRIQLQKYLFTCILDSRQLQKNFLWYLTFHKHYDLNMRVEKLIKGRKEETYENNFERKS